MPIISWQPLQSHKDLNDLSNNTLGIKKLICKFHQLYVVSDIYILGSIKESEYSSCNQKLSKECLKYAVGIEEMEDVCSGYSDSDTKLKNFIRLRSCNF